MADELQLARVAHDATLATEGVLSMGSGRYAEVATYGPGEKVYGVVVSPQEVAIHIVARYPIAGSLPELAERIRERVAPEMEGRSATVVVEDIGMDEDESI